MGRTYLCIDLKSFYASVECVERGLDPLTANLVVADPARTEKTICLAVSPSMKALGVRNRCRVFEIPKTISYIMAVPRMQLYIDVSAKIYGIYLRYVAKEDIHVYSIDEAFMDVTDYLNMYQMTGQELGQRIVQDVLDDTGITATCGIGTNLYLAKIAMDIVAKHASNHIGVLDEISFQQQLWDHRPLTDFWRIGSGTARSLYRFGIDTMGGIAHAQEETLYRLFGVDAELLIDHAWGRESTTMYDIKHYRPRHNSMSSGQVLAKAYNFEDGKLIVKEMTDLLVLDLVDKRLVTDSITLHISYDSRLNMKSAHGTAAMTVTTNAASVIIQYVMDLYEKIVSPRAMMKRVNICFNNVMDEGYEQYDLLTDPEALHKEHQIQVALLNIKKRYGKNAILKGMNLQEKGTTMERNQQIGGHRSG